MRAELINLPFTDEIQRRIDPPLFLLQLAPVLEDCGFSVRVNDLNGIRREMWGFGHCLLYVIYADVRGFKLASEIAVECKRANREAIIVACGSGPSKNQKQYARSGLFSLIACGEVEESIPRFIYDRIKDSKDIDDVRRIEVLNINKLPLPSRSLIEMNTYGRMISNKRAAMILGSRGSPYRQTWLCRGLKAFSVSRIINEVDQIIKVYGINGFFFGDESFSFDKERARNIGKVFSEKGLSFGFNDAISSIDYNLYKQLHELGAIEMVLNPSGNTDSKMIWKIKEKIENECGMKVMVKQDSKYKHMNSGGRAGNDRANSPLYREVRR